jgi:hypothetical protein
MLTVTFGLTRSEQVTVIGQAADRTFAAGEIDTAPDPQR